MDRVSLRELENDRKGSGRLREAYRKPNVVVIEGKLFPIFGFESGASFRIPVFFATKEDQLLPVFALKDYTC